MEQVITLDYNNDKEKVGFVYALVIPELKAIKFGVTNGSIHERVASLQTGCPLEIIPLASHLCDFSYELEKAIHTTFVTRSMKGEWFIFDDVTALFVWLNFGRILNANLFPYNITAFNPKFPRSMAVNGMYWNVVDMFKSPYYLGNEKVKIKPLNNSQIEWIQTEITIGAI